MNDQLLEKVKEYFNGGMNREEELLFESEMKTDKELADICELYQTIEAGIDGTEDDRDEALLRSSLKKLHEQYLTNERQRETEPAKENEEDQHTPTLKLYRGSSFNATRTNRSRDDSKVRSIKVWKRLAMAAVVIGIISISFTWFLQKGKNTAEVAGKNQKTNKSGNPVIRDTSHAAENTSGESTAAQDEIKTVDKKSFIFNRIQREAIYVRNFKADAIPASHSDLLAAAFERYQKGAYKDVIAAIDINTIQSSLEELRPRGGHDVAQEREEKQTLFYAHYYKALSLMADLKPEKAIPELRAALAQNPNRLWRSKTHWYLSLAYIKSGKLEEAKRLLRLVAKTKNAGEFGQKALTLIDELEKKQ